MISQTKRLVAIPATVLLLLLIPLIAMQFTDEVLWSPLDFLVMGTLLISLGLAIELVIRKVKKRKPRIILLGVVLMAFLLVWAELAVGIFGTPFAGS